MDTSTSTSSLRRSSKSSKAEDPPFGLLHVGEVSDPSSISLDIIIVHGLGGEAYRTWTHPKTGYCWIRDLSRQNVLPQARVLTFGYNARRMNHGADLTFEDVAGQLLSGISNTRRSPEENSRPVIFLAHSLGGLIVKTAFTRKSEQTSSIAKCTRGFAFFATPHCGSKLADFALTFERLSQFIVDAPSNFIRTLSTKSLELHRLNDNFTRILNEKKIPCLSFFEGNKSKKGFFMKKTIIVPKYSAVLGADSEKDICLNADHSSIVQFNNPSDSNLELVLGELRELAQSVTKVHDKLRRHHQFHTSCSTVKSFVGRDQELAKLKGCFLSREYVSKVVALYGATGVGKSQLALKYAEEHCDSYEHVILIDASTPEVLQNDFAALKQKLGIPGDSRDSPDKVVHWLSTHADEHWLLILDGVSSFRNILKIVSRLVHKGHIIITSLDENVGGSDFVQESIRVESLDPDKSVALLFERAKKTNPTPEDIKVAKELLEKHLGYLPLAIDSAGAYMRDTRKSIQAYTKMYTDVRFQKDMLHYRSEGSSYNRSVFRALELNFKEIDTRNDARILLSLLVFLDKAAVTDELLTRGSSPQKRWKSNGELGLVDPSEGGVPQELVELLRNDIRVDKAVGELTSLSIISCINDESDERDRAFIIHPLYQKFAKLRMSKEQRQTYSAQALLFLTHAFPCDEDILEEGTIDLARSYLPHLYEAYECYYETLNYLSVAYLESLADKDHRLTPCESIASLILDANITYGQGDGVKNAKLLTWTDELLKKSSSICLKARALEIKVAIHYYEIGDYDGAIHEAREFLKTYEQAVKENSSVLNEQTNAQIGVIKVRLAEILYTEVPSSTDVTESLSLLRSWSPLNFDLPSTKERITDGKRTRILGKVLKDHGDWEASAKEFVTFFQKFVVTMSQEEGWAAADWAHDLMELSRYNEAEDVLIKYLTPRQTVLTMEERREQLPDRRSDTMFLEILLGECWLLQKRYDKAIPKLKELMSRLKDFETLHHFERFRLFFILTSLARCHHLVGEYDEALDYWTKALNYCTKELDVGLQRGKWSSDTLLPNIVLLSISHCKFELGMLEPSQQTRKEAMENLARRPDLNLHWVLGLGTYWRRWLEEKLAECDKS